MLPFESVGGDTANTYFAEGLADELTTALSHVEGLRVAASGSAFTFGSGRVDARRVGQALHVDAVLQGRVRRAGDRVRVVAQLTSATSGLLLWSNSYEREVRDVFAVQDDLTRDIVAALRVTLAGGRVAPRPTSAVGTRSSEAHDLYLRGRYFLTQRGAGVPRSIPYFEQAIALDSGYVQAWAQLGIAWAVRPLFDWISRDSAMARSRAATAVALRLDSLSSEAHGAAGVAWLFDNNIRNAALELQRSVALDSANMFPYRPLISTLAQLGRAEDAVAQARRAVLLDPLQPTTTAVASYGLLAARHFDEALALARRAMELDSTAPLGRSALAIAEYYAGHRDVARMLALRAPWIPNTTVPIAFVLGATGTLQQTDSLVGRLRGEHGRNSSAWTAEAFAWLGAQDTTKALDALEHAARDNEPMAFQAAFGQPAYDAIRGSARFAAVVRSFGLDVRMYGAVVAR